MSESGVFSCRGYDLRFDSILIMGILNVTPDSFSDGGWYNDIEKAVEHTYKMVEEGADVIDIGGESTRPGALPIDIVEELGRVLPVVKRLVKEIFVPISIDTYKPEVAQVCLEEGVQMINDIYGLQNQEMVGLAIRYDVPTIIMHGPGMPMLRTEDVVEEVKSSLVARLGNIKKMGMEKMIIDPGFGFGKNPKQNYELLEGLVSLLDLKAPLLIGTSRKSFFKERQLPTFETLVRGITRGANILRVHDVKLAKRALSCVGCKRSALP